MSGFRTILVANRGEIACRVIRTAKAMGYRTVAVYSEADADALHVGMADMAACIGPPEARASYLNVEAIIAAARRTGAEAVHPGYGFLSEDAGFAGACAQAGLAFIGPSADAIAAMGNKAEAKRRMAEADVPILPGYQGSDQSEGRLIEEAERIGFPVMVKAAAGGGGRGLRLVSSLGELAGAIARARAEAESAFGSGELFLEKMLAGARHVEIQVLADSHGNVIHLGERDCSVQRRHQKVIEEAPSPAVTEELRQRMGAAAVAAASAIGYVNAGTVEFLLAGDGAFYFLEMNTRLQVEHPVTEMVTGLDLVELQIRIARGEALPLAQADVGLDGHAIEARLYAEAPHKGFLPQSGRLVAWHPPAGAGIRVDHGLSEGQDVTAYYDPLLAKVIAHGRDRDEARRRLIEALRATAALGPATNRGFLIDCLGNAGFVQGAATTQFVPTHFAGNAQPQADTGVLALAAVLWFEASARRYGHNPVRSWSSSGAIPWPVRLETGDGTPVDLNVSVLGPRRYRVAGAAAASELHLAGESDDGVVRVRIGDEERRATCAFAGETLHLMAGSLDLAVRETLYAPRSPPEPQGVQTEVRAPMSGKVVAVLVAEGEAIERGRRLVVVEAMKMQHEMTARASGTVARVAVKPGDQVVTRQLLVELRPTDGNDGG
jgi:geranyl-CoA carboxylase alpha subunit